MKLNLWAPLHVRAERREKKKAEIAAERFERLGKWHDFYAIFPRRVGVNEFRCFEKIQRRLCVYDSWLTGPSEYWEYRIKV